jgi:cell wall-associated NlpC family hydrolase
LSFIQKLTACTAVTVFSLCFFAVPVVAQKATPKQAKSTKQTKETEWQKYLRSADRSGKNIGQSLANKALSFRGVPYRFGGTTRNGLDCSGLTQAVYKKWGLLLPRTSTAQFKKGLPVPKDKLQPGDLVFFKNTYRSGISHVGIFVGDGKFVHAAGRGKGVVVSSLNEAYHRNHYAGARRSALIAKRNKEEELANRTESVPETEVADEE